eukprot:6176902-Pleurochrysis_carterae.AAC.1
MLCTVNDSEGLSLHSHVATFGTLYLAKRASPKQLGPNKLLAPPSFRLIIHIGTFSTCLCPSKASLKPPPARLSRAVRGVPPPRLQLGVSVPLSIARVLLKS